MDESAFRAVLRLSLDAGVHGLWVAGGSGEGVLLSEQENGRLDGVDLKLEALEEIRDAVPGWCAATRLPSFSRGSIPARHRAEVRPASSMTPIEG